MTAAHDTQALADAAFLDWRSGRPHQGATARDEICFRDGFAAALASRLQEQEGQPALSERAKFEAWKRTMQDGWNEWDAWQARATLAAGPQAVQVPGWRPIETAPKHTEVLVWRDDSGPFIAKLVTPEEVITPEEMEREGLEFADDFEEWFSDAYGWQDGSERPTHWQPLPAAPLQPLAGGEAL